MKIKVDENLPAKTVELLRLAGHDALSLPEQGYSGAPDALVSEVIRTEGRSFITLDTGFADIRMYPPEEYAGIIVIRPRHSGGEILMSILERMIPYLERERLAGLLWIVNERRIRVRGEAP